MNTHNIGNKYQPLQYQYQYQANLNTGLYKKDYSKNKL